jgi:predicted HTH domain antitoxin
MHLTLPDEILCKACVTKPEVALLVAIELYGERRIDYHDACILADVTPATMNRELAQRNMTIQITPPAGRLRQAG